MNMSPARAIAVAIGLAFSATVTAQAMSKTEYKAGTEGIAADYKSANAACTPLSGNARAICKAEAKGKRNVARAELEERRAPSDRHRHAVAIAKADADYAVARAGKRPAPAPAAASKKEQVKEYVDDSVITTKVKAAIFEEPSLKSAEINVETSKGRVQLSGFVRSRTDINKAVQVARKVAGVASVQNVMIVKGQQ